MVSYYVRRRGGLIFMPTICWVLIGLWVLLLIYLYVEA